MLTQQLKQINDRIADLEAQHSQYDDLTRAVQIQNDTYRTLAIRYETARDEANRNAQKISAAVVIAAPTVPSTPARPRRKLVAAATLLTALLAGCRQRVADRSNSMTASGRRRMWRTSCICRCLRPLRGMTSVRRPHCSHRR